MSKHRFFRSLLFMVISCCLISSSSWGLTVLITDPDADFEDPNGSTCNRGHAWDDCNMTSYLGPDAVNQFSNVFAHGWDAWNNSLPENEQWTLEFGSTLEGALHISLFDTINGCPDPGGVLVRAYYLPYVYPDGSQELEQWYWCQAVYYNYELRIDAPSHESDPFTPRYQMDVRTDTGWLPPIYPHQYLDGHYFDGPSSWCLEDSTVFFDAVALICQANWDTRVLTCYEGFSYGWKFECVSTPEPASVVIVLVFGFPLVMAGRRIRRGSL